MRLGLELAPLLERLGSTSRGGRTPLDDDALAWLALSGAGAEPGADGRGDPGADGRTDGHVDAVRAWAEATRDAVDAASRALDELRDLGGPIDEVLIGGGWAANPVLQTLKQNAFPHPSYPQVTEPGVRGAALLAAQAAGVFGAAADFPTPPVQQIPQAQEAPVT